MKEENKVPDIRWTTSRLPLESSGALMEINDSGKIMIRGKLVAEDKEVTDAIKEAMKPNIKLLRECWRQGAYEMAFTVDEHDGFEDGIYDDSLEEDFQDWIERKGITE